MKKIKAKTIILTIATITCCMTITSVAAANSRAEHINQVKRSILFLEDNNSSTILDICKEKKELLSNTVETPTPEPTSDPREGLDIVADTGYGSGIVRINETTYAEYIDNWSYNAHTFKMPAEGMKWYNETMEVMEKARAYGEREDEVWETAGYYYASRLFYNEEFDVMYEDGIVWVWSPTEDCYRTSGVTQW